MPIKPLSAADLDTLLRDTTHSQAKAQRVTPGDVAGQVLQGLAIGLGAAMMTGGVLVLFAPGEIVVSSSLTAGIIVAGVALTVRAIPFDRLLSVRRLQQVQATVVAAEFRKRKAYEAIQRLEVDAAARIAELERALAESIQDARNVRMELRRAQETIAQAGHRRTFVQKSNTEPQCVRDAQTIIRHWFDAGAWYSRPKALQAGWTEDRHAGAVRLLNDAGLVGKAGRLRMMTADSLDSALIQLDTWCERAEFVPVMPSAMPGYVEDEN